MENKIDVMTNMLSKTIFGWLFLLLIFSPCAFSQITEAPGEWVSIGPVSTTWQFRDVSGRATVVVSNPANNRDVWLGTATGGVRHTLDARAASVEWTSLLDEASSQSIGAIALTGCTSARCDTVYVGTGENNLRRDTYYGAGIYKLQWNSVENKYSVSLLGDTRMLFGHGSINNILLDGNDIYIAVFYGKTASASSATIRAPEPQSGYGVFKSSDDGQSWIKLGTNPNGAVPTDIELNQGQLYAGFLGQGIFLLSTLGDWCPLGPGLPSTASCPRRIPIHVATGA